VPVDRGPDFGDDLVDRYLLVVAHAVTHATPLRPAHAARSTYPFLQQTTDN
jgi:hypothetical protein